MALHVAPRSQTPQTDAGVPRRTEKRRQGNHGRRNLWHGQGSERDLAAYRSGQRCDPAHRQEHGGGRQQQPTEISHPHGTT